MRKPINRIIPAVVGVAFALHMADAPILALITGNRRWFENGWLTLVNFVIAIVIIWRYNHKIINWAKERGKLIDEVVDNPSEESHAKLQEFDAHANKTNKVANIAKWVIIGIAGLLLVVFVLAVLKEAGF